MLPPHVCIYLAGYASSGFMQNPRALTGAHGTAYGNKLSVYGSGVYFIACLCCLAPTDSSLQKGRAITLSFIACISAVYHKARILSSGKTKNLFSHTICRQFIQKYNKTFAANFNLKQIIHLYYFANPAPHQAFRVPQ